MDLNSILNQVLSAGQSLSQNAGSQLGGKDNLMKVGGGMAAGSLLTMLLGGKSNSMMKAGSLAAVGALAYKAYQSWQAGQAQSAPQQSRNNIQAMLDAPAHERGGQAGQEASAIILRTMIAAAAADGSIDAGEQQIILGELGQQDAEVHQWLSQQINNPATPEELARDIGGDLALASEAYLSARIICGDLDRKEIAFLSRFSDALGLDDALIERLEKQAGF